MGIGASPVVSQVSKLAFLLVLFLLAPFLPSFLRVPYFYLLFNVIVLALGVQAGLLRGGASAASSCAADDDEFQNKPPVCDHQQQHNHGSEVEPTTTSVFLAASPFLQRAKTVVPRPIVDVVAKVVAVMDVPEISAFGSTISIAPKIIVKKTLKVLLKKCPSTASIFFLCAVDDDGGEKELQDQQEADRMDDVTMMSRQELFARTERFLGSFRKQLRMQKGY